MNIGNNGENYNVEIGGRNFDVAYCNYYADACLLTPHNAFYVIRETLCYTKQLNFDLMHASEILRNTGHKDNRLNTTNLRAYDERNC